MNLDQSLFAKAEVVSREIELPDGSKQTFYFKPLSGADYALTLSAFIGAGMEATQRADLYSVAIVKSLCNADGTQFNPDGSPLLTLEKAKALKPAVFTKFWNAVFELNFTEPDSPDQAKK